MAVTNGLHSGWNHDFPRLARDAGFTFDTRRSKVIINWNDIKVIDIDQIIRERDFTTIDNHLTQVLDCQLEKEFDVRILDSGFVKLFRLSQLSVEYLVQCRRLLDTSITSLRRQVKEMAEEVEYLKKLLRNKEEEIRKLRNRTKKHQKAMDYVKTSDITNIFKKIVMNDAQSARSAIADDQIIEAFQKCQHCDKIFLNEFYLHSHLVRRHPNKDANKINNAALNSPGISPVHESKYKAETERLLQEIKELKDRVIATERRLNTNEIVIDNDNMIQLSNDNGSKTKDVEDKVEQDSMEKETIAKVMFESWKKDEELKFKEQMDILKKQLDETMKEFNKQKDELAKQKQQTETRELDKLSEILQRQETEMKALKEQFQQKEKQQNAELQNKLQEQEKMWQMKLKEVEGEHQKRIEDVNKNMASLMSDAKALQQQYTNKMELLQMEAIMQEKLLEAQKNKPKIIEQTGSTTTKESTILRNIPERTQSNFEELKRNGVGESTETLPPYDEGSTENITKPNIGQNSKKTNNFFVKNVSNTDDSIQCSNIDLPKSTIQKAVIKNAKVMHQRVDSSDEEVQQKISARKQLFPDEMKKKSKRKFLADNVVKSLSPVKNNDKSNNVIHENVENEQSSSDESEMFASNDGRSKTLSSFQRDNSNRESQRDRVMNAVKDDLIEILNKRLHQMGVEKNNKGMNKEIFDKNMIVVKHREELFSKKYDNYHKLKKQIINVLNEQAKELKRERNFLPNQEIRKSNVSLTKVGTILNNVKNKAISKIKDIKKSANESLMPRIKQSTNARLPVKNISSDNKKLSSASIISMASNLDDGNKSQKRTKIESETELSVESSDEESEPEYKQIVTTAISHLPSTSVENLLNSPIRKPTSVNRSETELSIVSSTPTKNIDSNILHFGDLSDVDDRKNVANGITKSEENIQSMYAGATSTSDESSVYEDDKIDIRKTVSEENINSAKAHSQKSVLKTSVSTSALAKKKVLFDLDANQIKSRSTSPSVSAAIEVKAKNSWEQRANEDTDDSDSEWNIPTQGIKTPFSDTYRLSSEEIKLSTKQSPKIAEISKTIGQQLEARNVKPPVGSINTLFQQNDKNSPKRVNGAYGGSTTSIGSSVFEGNYNVEASSSTKIDQLPVPKPRSLQVTKDKKLESDLELSDWSLDDLIDNIVVNVTAHVANEV